MAKKCRKHGVIWGSVVASLMAAVGIQIPSVMEAHQGAALIADAAVFQRQALANELPERVIREHAFDGFMFIRLGDDDMPNVVFTGKVPETVCESLPPAMHCQSSTDIERVSDL